jgi:tRNA/tmRNA/rRNA uracil-C5-methylase (TrmA/RlmC/RlmD family)
LLRKELPALSQLEEVEINVSPEEEKGIFILHPLSFAESMNDFSKKLHQAHSILKGIVISRRERSFSIGNPFLKFSVSPDQSTLKRELSLRASPGSFSQVNLQQNQALLRTVLEFGDINGSESVLDLYAGIGNLTLPLALAAK